MSKLSKELQKSEEKFLSPQKLANDTLSRIIAGGFIALLAAVAALVYGLPYFLYIPIGALVFLLVALALYFLSFRSRIRNLEAQLAQTYSDENTNMSPEFSPEFSPDIKQLSSNLVTPDTTLVPKGYELRKLPPSLVYLSYEDSSVYEDEHGIIMEGVKKSKKSFHALVQPFHNSLHSRTAKKEKKKIGIAEDVIAQLSFSFFDGQRPFTIHSGVWANEKSDKVNFDVNHKRRLAVLTIEGNKIFAVERVFGGLHPEGATNRIPLSGNMVKVLIRLLEEVDGSFIFARHFLLIVTDAQPVKYEWIEAEYWKWQQRHDLVMEGYHLIDKMREAETEADVIDDVKEWEANCVAFVKQHFTDAQSNTFVGVKPSIDEGFQRTNKNPLFRVLLQPGDASLPYWTLWDSIRARIEKLNELPINMLGN